MANQKLEVDLTTEDCHDLLSGKEFYWTFDTDKGVAIDIHLFNQEQE